MSRLSNAASTTTRSQRPNVGIDRDDEPHAMSDSLSSKRWKALATSVTVRAYSSGVLWPICQGPSISFPRHQVSTFHGSSHPWLLRNWGRRVSVSPFTYWRNSMASLSPRVPRLTASIGSIPMRRHHARNSLAPTVLGSTDRHAKSRFLGRSSSGPTPSSQR